MSDLYCVFGNPVAHSKSPSIHAAFALATGQDLIYEARLAAVGGFKDAISEFVAAGGKGASVTVPFKEDAFRLATRLSDRAARAGAVNTLVFNGVEIFGDNTDGAGLLRDIKNNAGFSISGKRILLLGAGGAARGVIAPLLGEKPASLFIANRSAQKAIALSHDFSEIAAIEAGSFAETAGKCFDLVVNGTSAALFGENLLLPDGIFAAGSLAYDFMYGKGETSFLAMAREQGAAQQLDGLCMLIEQAAEAFFIWRGVRPPTAQVLADLRARLGV